MELRQIKLYDWNVNATQALPGEENACIISFRLANVIGLEHFINCFKPHGIIVIFFQIRYLDQTNFLTLIHYCNC